MPVLLILGAVSLVVVAMAIADQETEQPADDDDPWAEFLASHPELV